jgi:L-lactate dehydrogenase complex protein LldE
MIHEYWPQLFSDTRWEAAARDVSDRVREFSSFVYEQSAGLDGLSSDIGAVTYHDSCHMMRTLGIKKAPRALLGAVEGLELRELDACERCCGFGGTFSLRFPEVSAAMADEKVDDAKARGVDTIVACDLGCLMQICGRARARGVSLEGKYIAEVLDEAAAR